MNEMRRITSGHFDHFGRKLELDQQHKQDLKLKFKMLCMFNILELFEIFNRHCKEFDLLILNISAICKILQHETN